jgi:hypothetical protein
MVDLDSRLTALPPTGERLAFAVVSRYNFFSDVPPTCALIRVTVAHNASSSANCSFGKSCQTCSLKYGS